MDAVTIMEIVLVIFSIACFVVSFVIKEKKPEGSGIDQEMARQEVREMLEQEKESLREPINNMATEYITFAYENAAKNIDDAANEKMFELTSYSDTVMREVRKEEEDLELIHRSVQEEQEKLTKTVSAAGKAAKVLRETIDKIHTLRPVEVSYGAGSVKIAPMASNLGDNGKASK
ncbi:MAG: hypothetical protein IKS85_03070 [Lachnospiraceae bacterium]|nr:hypothetical protein [Lachnospiraceae bacterium]